MSIPKRPDIVDLRGQGTPTMPKYDADLAAAYILHLEDLLMGWSDWGDFDDQRHMATRRKALEEAACIADVPGWHRDIARRIRNLAEEGRVGAYSTDPIEQTAAVEQAVNPGGLVNSTEGPVAGGGELVKEPSHGSGEDAPRPFSDKKRARLESRGWVVGDADEFLAEGESSD